MEETEQASEPDSDMAGMLELSDQQLKTAIINMLRRYWIKYTAFKNNGQCKQRDENSKNQKRNASNKTITDIKNAFDGLRPDTAGKKKSLGLRIFQ